ncbi:MAG: hypothetical protein LBD08_01195 [Treponema sp.]|jgi:hypothetical protein|nr:hypothetical protein [Treponema sp.]
MEIRINGTAADITLEDERTVGEVAAGLERWLQGAGIRICGLEIDGEPVGADAVPAVFARDIADVRLFEVKTGTRARLLEEALEDARALLQVLHVAVPSERGALLKNWEGSAAAGFLASEMPELSGMLTKQAASAPEALSVLVDERLRELRSPCEELAALESVVSAIAVRLEELPLDMQTGKDGRAAETAALFSTAAEKLFRLTGLLPSRDASPGALSALMDEFGAAVRKLLEAYTLKDTVLIGDLAEYELAPRLRAFYAALNASLSQSPARSAV